MQTRRLRRPVTAVTLVVAALGLLTLTTPDRGLGPDHCSRRRWAGHRPGSRRR